MNHGTVQVELPAFDPELPKAEFLVILIIYSSTTQGQSQSI
jgi:hypothetical protein